MLLLHFLKGKKQRSAKCLYKPRVDSWLMQPTYLITEISFPHFHSSLPLLTHAIELLHFDEMRVEAVARLHLAEHDVAFVYLVRVGHGVVCRCY